MRKLSYSNELNLETQEPVFTMRSKLRRATLSLAILEISIWADRTYTTCQPWHYAYRFDDLGRKVLKEDTRLTEQNPNEHLDQRAPNILWNEEVQPPMCIAILRPDKSHSEAEISGLEWYLSKSTKQKMAMRYEVVV
jgi:hypothetical protein